jgi:hypothetical protein
VKRPRWLRGRLDDRSITDPITTSCVGATAACVASGHGGVLRVSSTSGTPAGDCRISLTRGATTATTESEQPCTTASQQPPGRAHPRKLNRNSAAPLPIPSGKTKRHRLNRSSNRATNSKPSHRLHTPARDEPPTRSRRPHQRRTQVPRPPTWTRVPLVKSGGSHDPTPSQRPADVTVPPRWTGPSPSSARSTPTAEAASRTRPTRPPFWAPAVAPRAEQDGFSCRGLPIGMTRLPLPARRLLALTGTNTLGDKASTRCSKTPSGNQTPK